MMTPDRLHQTDEYKTVKGILTLPHEVCIFNAGNLCINPKKRQKTVKALEGTIQAWESRAKTGNLYTPVLPDTKCPYCQHSDDHRLISSLPILLTEGERAVISHGIETEKAIKDEVHKVSSFRK